MSFSSFIKDPDSKLDYGFDWGDNSTWMTTGDTISASVWTVPTGLTNVSDSFTNTTTAVWISGGTIGEEYRVSNKITTANGRIAERSFFLVIRQR